MRKAAWVVAGLVLAGVSGCGLAGDDDLRYRVTVDVTTPDGVKSGSSVMSLKLERGFPTAYQPTFRGEAVAVDVAPGATLFLLIDDTVMNLPFKVFMRTGLLSKAVQARLDYDSIAYVDFLRDHEGASAPLDCKVHRGGFTTECPRFVRFRNIGDPKSVEAVDAANLAARFGPGVALKSVTITITDEPVTTGIEKRLEWLGTHPETRLDKEYTGSTNPFLSEQLANYNFRREK